jgi:hypothetical protein
VVTGVYPGNHDSFGGSILFRWWERTLFVAVSVAHLLLTPFGEVYMDVGWTMMVGSQGWASLKAWTSP